MQPFGQGREAYPAQYHMRVREPGVSQAKVVQDVPEQHAGDPHPQSAGVGEVREPKLTLMELEIGILRIERRDTGQGERLRTWLDQHVLLNIEDYLKLAGQRRSLVEALSMPGLGDIDFEPPRVRIGFPPLDLS